MVVRIAAIAMNTYREAVRARILHGLFGLAAATSVYALFVGALSLHQEKRVVADIGAASISLYAVIVAVVLSATTLYRELELRAVALLLARPLRRHEYLLGKYFGTLATLAVFVGVDGAIVLGTLAVIAGLAPWKLAVSVALLVGVLAAAAWLARRGRVFVLLPWSLALWITAYALAAGAGGDRQVVAASAALTMCEVAIVAAVSTLFASFSTPFLTALFTLGTFVVGRSADMLANLPERVFGSAVRSIGRALAWVVPNLHLYVPARPLLSGEAAAQGTGPSAWAYVGQAALHALLYATVALVLSALSFRKRDFP